MHRPGPTDKKDLRIVVLYCQHSVTEQTDIILAAEKIKDFTINPVMLPCSSKVQVSDLLNLLDHKADGVEVVACADEACHFLIGSRRAEKRIEYAKGLLENIDVDREKLGISRKSGLSVEQLMKLAANRADVIWSAMQTGEIK